MSQFTESLILKVKNTFRFGFPSRQKLIWSKAAIAIVFEFHFAAATYSIRTVQSKSRKATQLSPGLSRICVYSIGAKWADWPATQTTKIHFIHCCPQIERAANSLFASNQFEPNRLLLPKPDGEITRAAKTNFNAIPYTNVSNVILKFNLTLKIVKCIPYFVSILTYHMPIGTEVYTVKIVAHLGETFLQCRFKTL
jgi:hypothetical protein